MDILILVQGLLYICMCITGLVVSITTGVNRGRFDGICILYASFNEKKWMEGSAASTCDYPIYVAVVGLVIYGAAMCIYHGYSLIKSRRDPNVGSQMWVLPILLINAILAVFVLVAACIVSVGYAIFCDNYLEDLPSETKCSIGEKHMWYKIGTGEKFSPGNYVAFMNSCMIAAWLSFLFVLLQIGLGILRIRRNRTGAHAKKTPGAGETNA